MKLIVEHIDPQSLDFIVEQDDETKEKSFRIKGPFIQTEVKNKNGRVYSKPLMEREVKRFVNEKVKTNRALGELDHPPIPTVQLDRVSHIIENLTMEGNDGIGTAKILNTPTGKIARALLEQDVKLGVSTRGVGSLNGSKVNDDFRLITVDIVADPSAPNAFVDGILENKEYIINDDRIVERAVEELEAEMKARGSKYIREAMEDFLGSVKGNLEKDR